MKKITHSIKKTLIFHIINISCFCLFSARAVEVDDIFTLSLEELMNVNISVATGTVQSANDSPAIISAYSSEYIQQLGVSTLDELLGYIEGFTGGRSAMEGYSFLPKIRGRRSFSGGNTILVLLDGLRLNDPVTGGVFRQDSNISLHHIKQVEVIRGPGSALYGGNAFSAVINLVSEKEKNQVTFHLGSFSQQEASMIWSKEIADINWSLSTRFYQDEGEHYAPFMDFFGYQETTQDPTKMNDFYLSALHENWSIYLRSASRHYNDFVISGNIGNGQQRFTTRNESIHSIYHWQATDTLLLEPFWDFSKGLQNGIVRFVPESPLNRTPILFWTDGSNQDLLAGNYRNTEQHQYGLKGSWSLTPTQLLSFGFISRHEAVSKNPIQGNWDSELMRLTRQIIPINGDDLGTGFYENGKEVLVFKATSRDVVGAYIQDEWQFNDEITLTTGFRVDQYEGIGRFNSLRASAVFNPKPGRFFKFLYGEAFRIPSFWETQTERSFNWVANANLQPEQKKSLEWSWIEEAKWGKVATTFFYNKIDDSIVDVLIELNQDIPVRQPQNVRKEEFNGIELSIDWRINKSLLLHTGSSYLIKAPRGAVDQERTHFFVLKYHFRNWNFNFSGQYHDSQLSRRPSPNGTRPEVILKDYWLFNLTSFYWLTAEAKLVLQINNLFDQQYRTFSQSFGLEQGIPGRGQAISLGIEYYF